MRAVNLPNLEQKGETNVLSQVRVLTNPKHKTELTLHGDSPDISAYFTDGQWFHQTSEGNKTATLSNLSKVVFDYGFVSYEEVLGKTDSKVPPLFDKWPSSFIV